MRHIEKLKKIFACCGKECTANTNGQALDQLVTLAENGELGSGGGSGAGVGIYKLTCKKSDFSYDYPMLRNINIKDVAGGLCIPLHCKDYEIYYDSTNAEVPESFKGCVFENFSFSNQYRGEVIVGLSFKAYQDVDGNFVYKEDIEVGTYKIPVYTKKYENESTPSVKVGELVIEVIE